MLETDNCLVAAIDIQEKLFRVMRERETLLENAAKLIRGAKILELPVVWAEQCPEKLGSTVPSISELLVPVSPITKTTFSCCGEEKFIQTLEAAGRKQIVLCGIEAHVCIYQTAVELVCRGYDVQVAADATSSRKEFDREIALQRMRAKGVEVTSVEAALFELVRDAKSTAFRRISRIVK